MNVTVEARSEAGNPCLVKLQGDTWELNIWATADELGKLADMGKTGWDQQATLQVGACANAPVWWNERDGTVYILVGHDDVTWDFGVTVPLSAVHNLLAELGDPTSGAPSALWPHALLSTPGSDGQLAHARRARTRPSAGGTQSFGYVGARHVIRWHQTAWPYYRAGRARP